MTKRIVIIGIVITVVLLLRQAYFFFGKADVTITIAPVSAAFTIDAKPYTATTNTTVKLSPGKHVLSVGPDGFVPVTQVINVAWQTEQVVPIKLQPKQFKQIFKNLAPDTSGDGYDAVQAKFFLNYTWAAAYIVTDQEGADPAVAVLSRVNGAWNLVLFSHKLTDADQAVMPPEVFDYIKDFKE